MKNGTLLNYDTDLDSVQLEPLDERSRHLRRLIFRAIENGGRGHIGPALSLVEMIRVLYDDFLRHNPAEPLWRERDRFILSKGHGCLALYAVLADRDSGSRNSTASATTICSGGHPKPSFPASRPTGALATGFHRHRHGAGCADEGRDSKARR
jgi:transketolase